jgi:hypothetical protein
MGGLYLLLDGGSIADEIGTDSERRRNWIGTQSEPSERRLKHREEFRNDRKERKNTAQVGSVEVDRQGMQCLSTL